METVFVYGTLRQGEQYHGLLKQSRRIALVAEAKGAIVDTGLGYPALADKEGRVAGELYGVSEEVLARLDELEDYYGPDSPDNEYERIRISVRTDSGLVDAWVYLYRRPNALPLIEGGDWKLYRLRSERELLYFAYGSCMDMERIELAGAAEWFKPLEGPAVLAGFNVQFTLALADGGRADIVESGGITEGKLYRIPAEGLNYLYAREGVEEGLYRPVVVPVVRTNGETVDALTFTVVNKEEETAPPEHYMNEILRGALPSVSAEYYALLKKRFITEFGFRG